MDIKGGVNKFENHSYFLIIIILTRLRILSLIFKPISTHLLIHFTTTTKSRIMEIAYTLR